MTCFAVVVCGRNDQAEAECRRFLIACIGQMPKETEMTTKTAKTKPAAKTTPTRMDASKEVCQVVMADVRLLRSRLPAEHQAEHQAKFDLLETFLTAAASRLPTQKAIDRDKQRKKNYHETKRKPRGKAKAAAAPAGELLPDLKLDVDQPSGTETFRHEHGGGTMTPVERELVPASTEGSHGL